MGAFTSPHQMLSRLDGSSTMNLSFGDRPVQDEAQAPYVSLVLTASDYPGGPLLLPDPADHTKNLAADPRLALLFDGTADEPPRHRR